MTNKIVDLQTYAGWLAASQTESINAAIHPAGVDFCKYVESGKKDAQWIIDHVSPDDYVMDYGCGNGRVLQFIPNKKVGIDVIRHEDWVVMPDEFEGQVDVIYSQSVFIHNTQATGREVMKWMGQHIRKGGVLYLQIPVYDEHKDPGAWIDVGVWTKEQLEEAANYAGLEIVEMHTNEGAFSFENIGENHGKYHVLRPC